MRPLTVDDLLPADEFAARRRELFHSFCRYVDRYRRIRVGPQATLVFENRQTLWFRVQDFLRVARLADPVRVEEELELYNRLLPGRDHLQAALIINRADEAGRQEDFAAWQVLQGDNVRLLLRQKGLPARLITCRPEDRVDGTAHWIEFAVSGDDKRTFSNFRIPVRITIDLPSYAHESPVFSEEIRQSLLDDLNLSERDGLIETDRKEVNL